jgi:hypothetical protein
MTREPSVQELHDSIEDLRREQREAAARQEEVLRFLQRRRRAPAGFRDELIARQSTAMERAKLIGAFASAGIFARVP